MKRINKLLLVLNFIFLSFICNPILTYADSGLEYNYGSNTSKGEIISSLGSPGLSLLGEILQVNPGDKDYKCWQIILTVISAILFYIFTNIYVFKLRKNKEKNKKRTIKILLINLIPTVLFILIYIFTKLYLILYILIITLYIIIFSITVKIILKSRINKKIKLVKEVDSNIDLKEFDTYAFNIYKEVQEAWMDFKLYKIKKIISEDMYNEYKEKLDELKNNNQQNIMEDIKLKKNKLIDIKVEDDKVIIECEMSITCYDYIINDSKEVIKGEKNKKCSNTYTLIFNKDIGKKNYKLVSKKIKK